MISRNPSARKTKARFLSNYNDIDVYVEDFSRETKKLFSRLLSNAWSGKVRFESVVPLGSRNQVLDACRSDQGVSGSRKRVYLIDGDLDLCFKRPTEKLIRLFRLPRYCVENYLIDEAAVIECIAYESEDLEFEEVQASLDFDGWVSSNATSLRRLFVGYTAVSQLIPSFKTISNPLSRFKSDASGLVDPLKIEFFLSDVRDYVDGIVGHGRFDAEVDRINNDFIMISDRDFMLHFVSGKDYLFPLLRLRMGRVVHLQRRDGLLKCNMAERIFCEELGDILEFAE